MSLVNPDLLYPVTDNNRDEILLVEYDGFIKNITEGIVIAMMTLREKYEEKYPKLIEYQNLTDGTVYDTTSLYSPIEFLKILSGNPDIDIENINRDIDELQEIDALQFQQSTMFEFTLQNLLEKKFISECCIIKQSTFYKHELEYILKVFGKYTRKLNIISGDFKEAFTEIKPTTCFINNINTITDIINNNPSENITNKLFILRNTSKTVYYSEDDKLFHYFSEIDNIIKEVNKTKIYYIAPSFIFRQKDIKIDEPVG